MTREKYKKLLNSFKVGDLENPITFNSIQDYYMRLDAEKYYDFQDIYFGGSPKEINALVEFWKQK